MVGFRHAHLYGEFQKSTAATQTVPSPRTLIATFATRADGSQGWVGGSLRPGEAQGARESRVRAPYRVGPTLQL